MSSNALDCLIIEADSLANLPDLCLPLQSSNVEIFADEPAYHSLHGKYPAELLRLATEDCYGREFLDYKMAIKTVNSFHIFTRLLTTEQYGLLTVYQSWMAIISVFTTLNLSAGVFNNGMIKYPGQKNQFLSSLLGLSTTVTAVFFIVYLIAICAAVTAE